MSDIFDQVERELNRRKTPTAFTVIQAIVIAIIVAVGGVVLWSLANPEKAIEAQAKADAAYDRAYEKARRGE